MHLALDDANRMCFTHDSHFVHAVTYYSVFIPSEVLPSLWAKLQRCQTVARQTQVQVPVVDKLTFRTSGWVK